MEGLEPTHLTALDPKSSASTNFATSAKLRSANVASFQNNAIDKLKILGYYLTLGLDTFVTFDF
jgi:hypothetical protein